MPRKGNAMGARPIVVSYYARRARHTIVKQTHARYPERAIAAALFHLRSGHYPAARFALVYDSTNGKELARLTPTATGYIVTDSTRS